MNTCESIQEFLAENKVTSLPADDKAHLHDCTECMGFLKALHELDETLRVLPVHEAPESAVANTLAAVADASLKAPRAAPPPTGRGARWRRATRFVGRPQVMFSAAASLLIAIAATILTRPIYELNSPGRDTSGSKSLRSQGEMTARQQDTADGRLDTAEAERSYRLRSREVPPPAPVNAPVAPAAPAEDAATARDEVFAKARVRPEGKDARLGQLSDRVDSAAKRAGNLAERFAQLGPVPSAGLGQASADSRSRPETGNESVATGLGRRAKRAPMHYMHELTHIPREDDQDAKRDDAEKKAAVDAFWARRSALTGLSFQDPTGYWSNTYVPGDPAIRLLQARLAAADRQALQAFAAAPLRLDDAAHPLRQPFDAPDNAALELTLHADRRGVEDRTRLLLQVGLQGTALPPGRRPPMTIGLVADLRGPLSVETATQLRALLIAFAAAKEVGDRFSLTIAGRPGATVLPPRDFTQGQITVLMQKLLAGEPVTAPESGDDLSDVAVAVDHAIALVRRDDDPNAPLGSTAVVLITSQPLAGVADKIAASAHRSAVDGVALSAIGLGTNVQLDDLDLIALAGQGNRRLLDAAGDARRIVEQELTSASRAVARAVRLQIRLAPGVQLLEVVGAPRLGEPAAQQVRDAESSIDQRVARSTGIATDRGKDDDGIQILIPTYYAGDAHVVLLDLVAPGPGPLAEVTVRYKDLVHLRNATARASLALPRGSAAPGTLERGVLKSFLVLQQSITLKKAAAALVAGDDDAALREVRDMATLLGGLCASIAELCSAADLGGSVAMLHEYGALLESRALIRPAQRAYLADSMQLAAYFSVVPRRLEN